VDYRYYRGERSEFSKKAQKYIHLLRYIGGVLIALAVLIPFLTATRVIEASYLSNFFTVISMILGPMLTIIGVAWNTLIDRG
jgi:hypothetical protein